MLRITHKSTQSLNRLSQNHIKDQLRSLIFQAPLLIWKYLILGLVHCRQVVDSSRYVIKGAKSKSKVDIKSALFTQVERVVKHLQLDHVRKQSRETVSGVIFVSKVWQTSVKFSPCGLFLLPIFVRSIEKILQWARSFDFHLLLMEFTVV